MIQMQKQHDTQIHNLTEMLRMEKFCAMLGGTKEMTESLIVKKEALKCSGKIYSEQHRKNFNVKDYILMVEMTLTMKAD